MFDIPKSAHAFPSSRIEAACPCCFSRIFLEGATHAVHLDPAAGLTSPSPVICPHCDAVLMLHHSTLHMAPRGTTAFNPRHDPSRPTPLRGHTSRTSQPRSGRIVLRARPVV